MKTKPDKYKELEAESERVKHSIFDLNQEKPNEENTSLLCELHNKFRDILFQMEQVRKSPNYEVK